MAHILIKDKEYWKTTSLENCFIAIENLGIHGNEFGDGIDGYENAIIARERVMTVLKLIDAEALKQRS